MLCKVLQLMTDISVFEGHPKYILLFSALEQSIILKHKTSNDENNTYFHSSKAGDLISHAVY
jgi:hypothetical protein